MKIKINADYLASTVAEIEVPVTSLNAIVQHHIKWETFYYCLASDPNTWREVPISDMEHTSVVDWKYPAEYELTEI